MRTALLSVLVWSALVCAPARAQDAPPEWKSKEFLGEIAVSRDGKWIACKSAGDFALYPAAGGEKVTLGFGKNDEPGNWSRFTADSKWLVVPGDASAIALDAKADTTQTLWCFPVDAPAKKKKIVLQLKRKAVEKDVKKDLPEHMRKMKELEGAARALVPDGGSRMLIDRGGLGFEVHDIATGAKPAPAPGETSPDASDASADGKRLVLTTEKGLEVRDAVSGVVAIEIPGVAKKTARVSWPRFTSDSQRVIVLRAADPEDAAKKASGLSDLSVECWPAAGGKRLWEAYLDEARQAASFEVTSTHAAAVVSSKLHIIDLRDGADELHVLSGRKVADARPTADGKGLWVIVDEGKLTRIALPPLATK